ncbi:MAG: 2-amino-4-hydroxy-6-hydroxymethyldihydropteridine diphosphokinase [bacterium]
MMAKSFIGIGTNIEPRLERMHEAIASLGGIGVVLKKSSIYESKPFGFEDQPNFLNAVVLLDTELAPEQLFEALKNLEQSQGRSVREKWHEREIDFDVLFYDDAIHESESLTIPHIGIAHRSFVLLPMVEIAPIHLHPIVRKEARLLLEELDYDKDSIWMIEERNAKSD